MCRTPTTGGSDRSTVSSEWRPARRGGQRRPGPAAGAFPRASALFTGGGRAAAPALRPRCVLSAVPDDSAPSPGCGGRLPHLGVLGTGGLWVVPGLGTVSLCDPGCGACGSARFQERCPLLDSRANPVLAGQGERGEPGRGPGAPGQRGGGLRLSGPGV